MRPIHGTWFKPWIMTNTVASTCFTHMKVRETSFLIFIFILILPRSNNPKFSKADRNNPQLQAVVLLLQSHKCEFVFLVLLMLWTVTQSSFRHVLNICYNFQWVNKNARPCLPGERSTLSKIFSPCMFGKKRLRQQQKNQVQTSSDHCWDPVTYGFIIFNRWWQTKTVIDVHEIIWLWDKFAILLCWRCIHIISVIKVIAVV